MQGRKEDFIPLNVSEKGGDLNEAESKMEPKSLENNMEICLT